jgi:hypothetical protein
VCRIQAATIVINEALLGCQSQPSFMSNLSRIERFHTCLNEVSSWYNNFIAIPPESYVGFTLFFMLEMGYSLLILARFTITTDPAWDPAEVRKVIDLVDVCGKIADRYQAAADSMYSQITFLLHSASGVLIPAYQQSVESEVVKTVTSLASTQASSNVLRRFGALRSIA